ncbi:HAD family hydrolase [Brenneria izbisi]|uniref:Histidinol-phosphatase n=1 Tax=Brenneria izbisi TaxID=2939450 RepID=A0AA41XV64_9GAMM|nr:HAD family hydrolase [Brenneria izbisi]MCV9877468.1 HAD-IB family hydrolase [Brenneria izbisi]MCV9880966.1 HAD-IB family hydrolase [Brenneria izbisi]
MSLALFDLDETLIDGDCASLWSQYMCEQGWVNDPAFLRTEQAMMRQYAVGALSMDDYMRFTLTPLAGRPAADVADSVTQFIATMIRPILRPAALRCVQGHRERGDRLIIISASGAHLVEPIARCFGIHETLCIDLEVRDGCYTGQTQGILTFGAGKVARLHQLLGEETHALDRASFYSDSINDLPLLQQVGLPHVVNPDDRLLQQAQQAGWPILHW